MARFKLYLLGQPHLERAGTRVEFGLRKAEALFYYLAASRETHTRDSLATIFWPEDDQRTARANLRRALHRLNDKVGAGVIHSSSDAIEISVDAPLWVDAIAYQESATHALTMAASPAGDALAAEQQLENVVTLYRSELLHGFSLPDCPQFDEWVFFEQERLRHLFLDALTALIQRYQTRGAYERAIPHLQRKLAAEPYAEQTHRDLIRLYALAGRRSAALRQCEACRRILKEELDAEPEAETLALIDAVRANRLPASTPSPAPQTPSLPALSSKERTPPNNLPASSSVFVGRSAELAEIERLITGEPGCRLLTLIGAGGIGKTRLSLEVAGRVLPRFADGVFFVPLDALDHIALIAPAIADAVHLGLHDRNLAHSQLLRFCRAKEMLIVLDNFEHLLEGAEFISELLAAAPGVKVMATSRERLHLHEEWIYDVRGLPYPPSHPSISPELMTAVSEYAAVQLFVKHAQRTNIRFASDAIEELAAIAAICRLVAGMPLAMELAAAWIRYMSPQEIRGEIEKGLALLATPARNVPERHRSMRVVFEETWRGLPELERETLMRLAVFHGGCRRDAAEAVTGASLHQLVTLLDRSLLAVNKGGRYRLHALLRQFALEELQESPADDAMAVARHRDYFAGFLEDRTDDIKGGRELAALEEIAADMDNIRAAWRSAVDAGDLAFFRRSAETLWEYSEIRGALQEGAEFFARAAEVTAEAGPREAALYGFLLAGAGWLRNRAGEFVEGRTQIEQGVDLLRNAEPGNRRFEATAVIYLGFAFINQGDYAAALPIAHMAMELVQTAGHRWTKALCLLLMGAAAQLCGRLQEAETHLNACHALCAEIGNLTLRIYANYNLVNLAHVIGAYDRCIRLLDENLTAAREFNNQIVLADSLSKQARTAIALGEYEAAVARLRESLRVLDSIGRNDAGIVRCDLGQALCYLGDYAAAARELENGLEAACNANHPSYMAACLNALGRLAFVQRRRKEAVDYHRRALTIWQEQNNEPEMALTFYLIGHATCGEHTAEAMDALQAALRLAIKHRLAPVALGVFVTMAPALARQGKRAQAEMLLDLVLTDSAATHLMRVEARSIVAEIGMSQAHLQARPDAPPPSMTWMEAACALADSAVSAVEGCR